MTFDNWYTFNSIEFRNPRYQKLDAMPNGLPVPKADELLVQAPTNVASGTFYLDRLLVSQTPMGLLGQQMPDIVRNGIPDEPIDPTSVVAWDNHGMTVYFGKFARRDPVPESLNPEQQRFIDGLREKQQGVVNLDSPAPAKVRERAKQFIDKVLVKQADGTYRYPEQMNLITFNDVDDALIFPGDHMAGGSKTNGYRWVKPEGRVRARLINDIKEWSKYPACEALEIKVKATLDWLKYQGFEDGKQCGGNWHGVYMNRDLNELAQAIPVFKAKGTAKDMQYARYLNDIIKWGNVL